ncbi:Glu/Leu/Phe/Val dehydrogenase dimerization domain-containing protein, partial [Stenotrophomonas acidaminiphila]
MNHRSPDAFLAYVARRDPDQPEFLQAVKEVTLSLWPFLQQHPQYARHGLLERLVEPERVIQFRVAWADDSGRTHVNRAFRVQHSAAIGPFKGGMRFHPSVNLSILKFLAFEQTFKNALTTLPMGGGKGGADFDPKGKSEGEVMRFCQALMLELYRHLGADTDVPAGDIGVGAREVGFMAGMMKKLSNDAACVFTGKGLAYGGSLMRPEATGYGTVYFVEQMLHHARRETHGAKVLISGSGNVAQFAALKAAELGGKVLTFSDSGGTLYARDGFDEQAMQDVMALKNERRGRLAELAGDKRFEFLEGRRPWHIPADIALPCATQNELDETDARTLVH